MPWGKLPSREVAKAAVLDYIHRVPDTLREYRAQNMRVSYLVVFGLMVIGGLVNYFVPHGWTVWPFVMAIGLLIYINEAAARNGTGVPPFRVYALFMGAVIGWIVVTMLLSVVSVVVVLLGVTGVAYWGFKGYLRQREQERIIAHRREEGRCIHCGELADPSQGICLNCGEEPDPAAMQLERVQAVVRGGGSAAGGRARAALKQDSLAAAARKKEAALMAKSSMRRRAARKK